MANRRILVVDDEENIGRSLRMILEREGYQVNAVGSAAEMRAFPDRSRIDLFLMEVRLPDAGGDRSFAGTAVERYYGARDHDFGSRDHH